MTVANLSDSFDAVFGQHRGNAAVDTVMHIYDDETDPVSSKREAQRTNRVAAGLRAQYRAGDEQAVLDHLRQGYVLMHLHGRTWVGNAAGRLMLLLIRGHMDVVDTELDRRLPDVAELLDALGISTLHETRVAKIRSDIHRRAVNDVLRKRLMPTLAQRRVTTAMLLHWTGEAFRERAVQAAGQALHEYAGPLIRHILLDYGRDEAEVRNALAQTSKLTRAAAARIAVEVHDACITALCPGEVVACYQLYAEMRARGARLPKLP